MPEAATGTLQQVVLESEKDFLRVTSLRLCEIWIYAVRLSYMVCALSPEGLMSEAGHL